MFAVDLDSVSITQSVVARSPLARVTFVTRNNRRVPVRFFRQSSTGAVELAAGSTGQILIKKKGYHESDALARALTWTKEGSGSDTIYWFDLDLFTTPMDAAFPVGTEKLDDLILELTFAESGEIQTPPAIGCTIWNRYLQSDEDVPSPADPDMPAAADILIKGVQNLTDGEQTQIQTNLGLAAMLCRESIDLPAALDADAPADFALVGESGQYAFDSARSRLWIYIGAQWHFTTLISG